MLCLSIEIKYNLYKSYILFFRKTIKYFYKKGADSMLEIDIGYVGRERTDEEREEMREELEYESRESNQVKKDKLGEFVEEFQKRQKQYTNYRAKRNKKFPWEELYSSVVNDFNDDYNLSNEEKAKRNRYYEYQKEFIKGGYKCRDVVSYVKKARISIKWLYEIYNNIPRIMVNEYTMDFTEFLQKAKSDADKIKEYNKKLEDGKNVKFPDLSLNINLGAWSYPKYKPRKNALRYDEDYLEEFILTDRDPSELIPENTEPEEIEITEDNLDEVGEKLFGKERWKELQQSLPEDDIYARQYDPDEDDIDDHPTLAIVGTEDDAKALLKFDDLKGVLGDIARRERGRSRLSRCITDIHEESEMTYFDDHKFSKKYQKKNDRFEIPSFKGDINDDRAFEDFMSKLEDIEDQTYYETSKGKMMTGEEIDMLELKEFLSENGWKINALRGLGGKKDEKKKKKKKTDYDKVREVKRKLTKGKVNKKVGVNTKKKKKKKENKAKKKQKKDLETTILSAAGNDQYSSFDEWRASLED